MSRRSYGRVSADYPKIPPVTGCAGFWRAPGPVVHHKIHQQLDPPTLSQHAHRMKISEAADDRLVLVDRQLDKTIAIALASVVLLYFAYEFSVTGDWAIAAVPTLLAAAGWLYLRHTRMHAVFTFDRPADKVTLVVRSRRGREVWDWTLSDIKTAAVSTVRGSAHDLSDTAGSTLDQPVFVLRDGSRVPMRPYHSAGSQSWEAVEAIRKFLGDDNRDDFPVGWIFDPD